MAPTVSATGERHRMALTADQRWIAAKIDTRMQKLIRGGKDHMAIMVAMADHMPAFHQLLSTAQPGDIDQLTRKFPGFYRYAKILESLAALCREYPGFHTYAVLMEEAAEAERQKPARPYDDLPEFPDALKEQLSSLLSTAAKLERDYQSVLNAAGTSAPVSWLLPLSRLHAQWEADLTCFRAAIQCAGVPQKSHDMVLPALERMAQQIGRLKAHLQA